MKTDNLTFTANRALQDCSRSWLVSPMGGLASIDSPLRRNGRLRRGDGSGEVPREEMPAKKTRR